MLSRCVNYKINLTNTECLDITNKLLGNKLENLINEDLINYYFTPGNVFNLVRFANHYNYNLLDFDLKHFLKMLIKENFYKKDLYIRYIIFDLIEFYLRKLNTSFSKMINQQYSYFLKRIDETKNLNLDEESLFMEFDKEILNG